MNRDDCALLGTPFELKKKLSQNRQIKGRTFGIRKGKVGKMIHVVCMELAIAFFVLLTGFEILNRMWRMRQMPPGPIGLPIVGSMAQIPKVISNPNLLGKMVERYGPIFTMWNGSTPTIIVTTSKIAREALVESGSELSSRPTLTGSAMDVLTNGYKTINSAPYGQVWRTSRRNLVSGVLHPSFTSCFEKTIEQEVMDLVERLKSKCSSSKFELLVAEEVRRTLLLIFIRMVFGTSLSNEVVEEIDELLREASSIIRPAMSDHSPVLKFLCKLKDVFVVSSNEKRMQAFLAKQKQLLGGLILARAQQYSHTGSPICYVDTLIAAGLPDALTLTREILLAGIETTTSCIEWALARITGSSTIQAQLLNEMLTTGDDGGSGDGWRRRPDELPYLRAVIQETLRRHPPVYVTAPHATTARNVCTTIAGYEIPPDAAVFVHLQAIGSDAATWRSPREFAPERFSDYVPDLHGRQAMDMIPFSAGRRVCPGRHLGMFHVRTIVANLVRHFEWAPSSSSILDFTPMHMGLSVTMKTRLRATISKRQT